MDEAESQGSDRPGVSAPPATGRPGVDVVAIGASAGGVTALRELISGLPPDIPVALLVVLHMSPAGTSVLADILRRSSDMRVVAAVDGMELERGCVVVARPDHHLVLEGTTVRLTRTAKVNGHRPAIDPTFESATRTFDGRVLGILLSGTLDDGVAGLAGIREDGGITAVQQPAEAAYPGMPRAAIEAGVVDEVLTVDGLVRLVKDTAAGDGPLVPVAVAPPVQGSQGTVASARGALITITCPNCGGNLWERQAGGVMQYECRVGHRYSPAALFSVHSDVLDDALWAAHRALLERSDLVGRMAERMRGADRAVMALRYDRMREEAERRAGILHEALMMARDVEAISEQADGAPV